MSEEKTSEHNIVVCSDGTGNRGGPARPTNVWRTYLAVEEDEAQFRIHDDGVGTSSFRPLRLIGGAFGFGISQNLRELYTSLIYSHRADSRIFLFGFSRGAYTVRVLANMICMFGIPNPKGRTAAEVDQLAREALRKYKAANRQYELSAHEYVANIATHQRENVAFQDVVGSKIANSFRTAHEYPECAPSAQNPFDVHFLGCWDTVEALGLPFDELTRMAMHVFPLKFRNGVPNPRIRHLCHALSLDDERKTFHPKVWEMGPSGLAQGQILEQVWFPGAHSHVGGGYAKDQLALGCLDWMLRKAGADGLRLDPEVMGRYASTASPHGELRDSRTGVRSFYRYKPRRIEQLQKDGDIKIHVSAIERLRQRTDGYAPKSITANNYTVVGGTFSETSLQRTHRLEYLEKAHKAISTRVFMYWVCLLGFLAAFILGFLLSFRTAATPLQSDVALVRGCLTLFYSAEHLVLDTLTAFLPTFAGRVFQGYATVPGLFTLCCLVLGCFVYVSYRRKRQLVAEATEAWAFHRYHEKEEDETGRVKPEPSKQSWLTPKNVGIAAIAILLVIVLGLYGWRDYHQGELDRRVHLPVSPIEFDEALPIPIAPQTIEARNQDSTTVEFDTKCPYFATGVFVVEDELYEIEVSGDPVWTDGTLKGSANGLNNEGLLWLFRLAVGRDHWAPLFKLMAGIGPDARHRVEIGQKGEFKAPVSGPLYLFVNDVPGFYYNNQGTAEVTIKRLKTPAQRDESATNKKSP